MVTEIGFEFNEGFTKEVLFLPDYGSLIIEISSDKDPIELFHGLEISQLGTTINQYQIIINKETIDGEKVQSAWEEPLESIFPVKEKAEGIMKKIPY